MTTEGIVRQFVAENFYVSDAEALTDDMSLIESGIVDSTGILEVILFLESSFGIHVEDEETIPENLESISQIAAFVARKKQVAAT
jgi:acyl carrier protein